MITRLDNGELAALLWSDHPHQPGPIRANPVLPWSQLRAWLEHRYFIDPDLALRYVIDAMHDTWVNPVFLQRASEVFSAQGAYNSAALCDVFHALGYRYLKLPIEAKLTFVPYV